MTFLWCNLPLSSKITILGYISSCRCPRGISFLFDLANLYCLDYALASGFPLTILNYFLVGWFNGYLDKFYLESWRGI